MFTRNASNNSFNREPLAPLSIHKYKYEIDSILVDIEKLLVMGDKKIDSETNLEGSAEPRRTGRKYIQPNEHRKNTTFEKIAILLSWFVVLLIFPLSIFFCFTTIPEFKRAIFFRLGRVRKGAAGPGLVWYLPCIDSYALVDLRTRVEVIPTQEMITRDSVTISVDAVLFYYITGSLHATIQISNVHESTLFIAQTTLRNVVGGKTLHELLTSRESLSHEIGIAVDRATEKWGVRIERVALKDINLPEILHRTMAAEAEAMREARAKIISAEGEVLASQALKEASDVMAKNKITLQLRHLQILTSIAHERMVTIYYPFPLEILTPFETRKKGGCVSTDSLMPILKPRTEIKSAMAATASNQTDEE